MADGHKDMNRQKSQTTDALDMGDPADRELHTTEGKRPYPRPAKTKVEGKPKDDTADPAKADPDAPHDRGVAKGDTYVRGVESMRRKVKPKDEQAWREGRTQN